MCARMADFPRRVRGLGLQHRINLGLLLPSCLANVLAAKEVSTKCRLQMEAEIDAKVASFSTPLWRLLHDRRNDMSVMAKKVLCIGGGLFGIIICAFGFLVSMVDSDS